jgi:hypothetical protein
MYQNWEGDFISDWDGSCKDWEGVTRVGKRDVRIWKLEIVLGKGIPGFGRWHQDWELGHRVKKETPGWGRGQLNRKVQKENWEGTKRLGGHTRMGKETPWTRKVAQ